ncbi:AMP-binding protein [Streptomyces rubiginosohelvolus]|uniref:AMP-binding protein n=1 Tax=Streptomyces rubiginosohelvolus TaxID=67362 RepID=UPI0037B41D70
MTHLSQASAEQAESDLADTARSHLLGRATTDQYRETLRQGVERVADRLRRTERPFSGISPAQLAPHIAAVDLDQPLGTAAAALDELDEVYLRDAVYFHHPRYLAHLNCPVVIPAVLGEAVLSAVNSSLDTWDQSGGGTLIEQRLIGWTARRIGLGRAADGVFTSGGTQSNLQALLMARDETVERAHRKLHHPGQDVRPAKVLPRLRILASDCAHFSVVKSAALLGLDEDAVHPIATDAERRMRPDALAAALDDCRRDGLLPMAVVATAGTTDFGSIDPLPRIAELCRAHDVWLHVDAAYGCGLLVSRRRHLLRGIEQADSVTVDFHKSFFQPVSSSALLVKDRDVLRHVAHHADYLNPVSSVAQRIPNQVDKSLQTTRRFDALKLWMTLRVMGADAIGSLFDEVVDLAERAGRLLAADLRFRTAVPRPQLSTLVFRWEPLVPMDPALVDEANRQARRALAAAGAAVIAATVVDGRDHLKFTLLNPETTLDDIAEVLDLVDRHACMYVDSASDGCLAGPPAGNGPSTRQDDSPLDQLHHTAATSPDAVALRDAAGAWTYAELVDATASAARWLHDRGVGPGRRVVVRAVPDRWVLAAMYGCFRLGAVFVPVHPELKPYQWEHVLSDAEPVLVLTDATDHAPWPGVPAHHPHELAPPAEGFHAPAPERHRADPDDPALLLYTSGSTAHPKAVICPHGTVAFAARAVAERLHYRPDDVIFCRLPLSFDYGLYQMFLGVLAGSTLVLARPGNDARLLADLRAAGATVVPLVPSLATMLLTLARRDPAPVPVRLFTNTGEHLSSATADLLRERFPGAQVHMMFGTTECKRITVLEADGDRDRPGSVGRALPGTRIAVVDEAGLPQPPGHSGEITVRGPHLMAGYWRAPDQTARTFRTDPATGERVLHTGDVGRLDAEGHLYFEGREDQVFKRRGTRMSTTEIEAAAQSLAGVRAAVVLPPAGGRDTILFVAGELAGADILNRLAALLDPAKVPAQCRVLTEFPVNANGKTDRAALRRMENGNI